MSVRWGVAQEYNNTARDLQRCVAKTWFAVDPVFVAQCCVVFALECCRGLRSDVLCLAIHKRITFIVYEIEHCCLPACAACLDTRASASATYAKLGQAP